jgi:hypothetical protein
MQPLSTLEISATALSLSHAAAERATCNMVTFAAETTAATDIECPSLRTIAAAPQKSSPRWWLFAAVLAAAALLVVSAIATLSAEVRQLNIQLEAERSHSSRALQELNATECIPVVQAFNGTRRLEVGVTSTRSMQLTTDLMGGTKGKFSMSSMLRS